MIVLRARTDSLDSLRTDLARPHPFAFERVGFVTCRHGTGENDETIVLVTGYTSVADDLYVRDPGVGARIGSDAIREAMQHALDADCGLLHVHAHVGRGKSALSGIDRREIPRLIQSFRAVKPDMPHGILLLSDDSCSAWIWPTGDENMLEADQITVVGRPMQFFFAQPERRESFGERFSRQSFLGTQGQNNIERARIAIVGLGGGGSHINQQNAHLGVSRYRLFDSDCIDESNLNRTVGAQLDDVACKTLKVDIAERVVLSLTRHADVLAIPKRWQEHAKLIHSCDIVFGCVDSFAERRDLEAECRRYLVPYIDIGMGVMTCEPEPPRMSGHILLSMPGRPCMWCLGYLTEKRLAEEASRYGDAGPQPQVVWANGVLASSAVGVAVDLLAGWSGVRDEPVYLSYDGNLGTVTPHVRLEYASDGCVHYPGTNVGDAVFKSVSAN